MSIQTVLQNPKVRKSIYTLTLWSPIWIGSTVLFGALSLVYVIALKKDVWLASQAITIRDETAGSTMRLGRFESSTHLKAAQETVLELARNQQVIRNAFIAAGPEPSLFGSSSNWPTTTDIKEFADQNLSVHAPRGAEFGATEVVYLDVKHTNGERAILLNRCVCESLDTYMRQVRENRAESIVEELKQARNIARQELDKSTKTMQAFESEIGSDLSDLRNMVEIGGNSNSRTALDQLRQEMRLAETKYQELQTDIRMLEDAAANPSAFISAPGSLLNSQPGLKKLREGLVDIQLSKSQLSGKFTDDHPSVVAARTAELDIMERLNIELQAALKNGRQNLTSAELGIQRLLEQQKSVEERMERLAEKRATYGNIVSEVKTRTNILESTERELAEAEASRIASLSTSLLTRVDGPVLSDKPIGPGKSLIVIGGTMAGLATGLGLVLLLNPLVINTTYGRRWNDAANQGRRSSDRVDERADAFLARQPAASNPEEMPSDPLTSHVAASESTLPAPSSLPVPSEPELELQSLEKVDRALARLSRESKDAKATANKLQSRKPLHPSTKDARGDVVEDRRINPRRASSDPTPVNLSIRETSARKDR